MDTAVPVEQSREYEGRARAAGDDVAAAYITGAGHFDLIAPRSDAWMAVTRAVRELLGIADDVDARR
jgi:hypothetical protein